jgi:hypothetical protein
MKPFSKSKGELEWIPHNGFFNLFCLEEPLWTELIRVGKYFWVVGNSPEGSKLRKLCADEELYYQMFDVTIDPARIL